MTQHPQSQEAEKGLICAFFIDPITVGRLCEELGIGQDHFHHPAHATIFEVLQYLHGERMEFDFRTVTQMLKDAKKLTECGGPAYISELATYIGTAGMARVDADTLLQKKWHRDVLAFTSEFSRRAMEEQNETSKLMEDLQKAMLGLCQPAKRRVRHNVGQIAAEIYDEWIRCDSEALFGAPTGLATLDAEVGGFCKGDLVIIMAPTSGGKSAFAQLLMLKAAQRGERVLDVTFEMTAKQRVKRLMQMISKYNLRATMTAERDFDDPQAKAFAKAVEEIRKFKLEVIDDRGASMRQVCGAARNLASEGPFSLVVIDYDELVKGERSKGASKEEEIAGISSAAKTLAGELDCPVILLSQQTIGANGVAKARWSTGKQNDANIMLQIESSDTDDTKTLSILKNRDGKRGAEITFDFDGPITTFRERK